MKGSVPLIIFILFCITFLSFSIVGFTSRPGCIRSECPVIRTHPTECQKDEECQNSIEGSECLDGKCKCPRDELLGSDGVKCLKPAAEFGSECEDNAQCSSTLSAGGVCINNQCKCKTGYHYLEGYCWKNIEINEKCHKREQCFSAYEYVGMECKTVCTCRSGYHIRTYNGVVLNSGCRRNRQINETCNLDSDCPEGSSCQNMHCTDSGKINRMPPPLFRACNAVSRHEKNLKCCKGMFELNGKCVAELGSPCSHNDQCSHIKNALCLDNYQCACNPVTYVASEDNRKCLQVARGKVENITKSSCKEDSQCGVFGGFSFCLNKKCSCKEGSYWDYETQYCWPIKSLGQPCAINKDCHPLGTNAECSSARVCTCPENYHEENNICMPNALKVGDKCKEDSDCVFDHSFCNSSNVCACKVHYYFDNQKCVPGVGSTCNTNKDCAHLNNTLCYFENSTEKKCLCRESFTSSDDYSYCLPVSDYKQNCEETFQCRYHLGELGECKNQTCVCKEKSHYLGKCYESKFVGSPCTRKPECFPGNDRESVVCMNGYCSCQFGYTANENGYCVKANSGTSLKFHSILLTSSVFVLSLRR